MTRSTRAAVLLAGAALFLGVAPADPIVPVAGAQAPETTEVSIRLAETALLDALKAATPYSVTVGKPPLRTDLVFSEPTSLVLADGQARLRMRVRGSTIPIDQPIDAVLKIEHDRIANRYYAVLSSLPLALPGLGQIDLKDYLPRIEIPSLLHNLWRFPDRPVGLSLTIRRLAIEEHALRVGADVRFNPIPRGE